MTIQLKPYGLRIPDDLKAIVKDAAAREGRSMNAQIVHHLREIYQPTRDEAEA
ncbi:Arc family DNA-binding protein [Roseobacter sp. AzwK-3b]|uniref:Arc family DNA-binding protein n=1 Tax=Roseobacter sp. AzwK-3b TaxID=351016 RepID=UPI0012F4F521|nr:Arc family DNA-binding protein [Roseobacter sp. AzwK-3b]